MKYSFLVLFLGAAFLWTQNSQAALAQNHQMASKPGSQVAGKSIQPSHVKLDEFHGRHPEAKVKTDAKTGVGCDLRQGCYQDNPSPKKTPSK